MEDVKLGLHLDSRNARAVVSTLRRYMMCPHGLHRKLRRRQLNRLDVFDLDDLPIINYYLGVTIRHPFRKGVLSIVDRLKKVQHAEILQAKIKQRTSPAREERSRQFFAESSAMAKRGTPNKQEPINDGPWWENRNGSWEDVRDEDEDECCW